MRFFVLFVVVVGSACAPMVHVVREEKPVLVFAPEQQPISVSPQESGVGLVDLFSLFSDAHARDVAATDKLVAALHQTGRVTALSDCGGPCAKGRSQLFITVSQLAASAGEATATLTITLPDGSKTESVGRSLLANADDATRLNAALDDAAEKFAARLLPHEVTDSFVLVDDDDLKPGNERLINGDAQGAIAAYQAVTKAKPNDVGALLNLAVAMTAAGDLTGAVAATKQAAEAETSSLKLNRENAARAAAVREATTQQVLSFTTAAGK